MRILSTLLLSAVFAMPLASVSLADTAGTITVTGAATVNVVPDLATIQLGVTTQGTTAAEAMAANTAALTGVIARLKTAGVADRDMQTSNLSLNPNWVTNSAGTGSEVQGYIATNMLTVRVRALDSTGAVLDASISDGANTLNGLTFGLQDPRPQEDAARKAAVVDAMARAKLLVEAAGQHLGRILSISEQQSYDGGMPMAYSKVMDAAPVPVAGGEVGISAQVSMVFEIAQ